LGGRHEQRNRIDRETHAAAWSESQLDVHTRQNARKRTAGCDGQIEKPSVRTRHMRGRLGRTSLGRHQHDRQVLGRQSEYTTSIKRVYIGFSDNGHNAAAGTTTWGPGSAGDDQVFIRKTTGAAQRIRGASC
jgi:hypothetical protein